MSGVVICGGDWNIHLHPSLDSSSCLKTMTPESLNTKRLLKEIFLIDIWRDLHPGEKGFTFSSHFQCFPGWIIVLCLVLIGIGLLIVT